MPWPVVVSTLLNVIIDIGSLYHLSKVESQAVKDDSGLSICLNVFMAGPRDCRGRRHQLRAHQNNDDHDGDRHEQFNDGETLSGTAPCDADDWAVLDSSVYGNLSCYGACRHTCCRVGSGSTAAGQVTRRVASEVVSAGGAMVRNRRPENRIWRHVVRLVYTAGLIRFLREIHRVGVG